MRRHRHLSIFILTIVVSLQYMCSHPAEPGMEKRAILYNEGWEFSIDTIGHPMPSILDDQMSLGNWEQVTLPHTAMIEPLVVNDLWQGSCWYKKHIAYQSHWKNKKIFVRFEGAMNVAEIWVNDTKKATHQGGYLPFVLDITDDLQKNGVNTIYVKLNNEDNAVTGPKPNNILDFNMYAGIYRDVFLLVKDPIHITDEQFAATPGGGGIFVTYPEVSKEQALLSIAVQLENSGSKPAELEVLHQLEYSGKKVAETMQVVEAGAGSRQSVVSELTVDDPDLWSPSNPALYQLKTSIRYRGKVVDHSTETIGIRSFTFKDNKLFINGEPAFLRGVNRHQEYPYIGYALSNSANYRDAYKIKEAGFDFVRLSHYPQSPAFLDACDELGLVTINPILGWQYYKEDLEFKKHAIQTVRDLIRRDRNHACVLAWEVSLNESRMPEEFIDSLITAARNEFPDGDCYTAGWQEHGYDIFLKARQHRLRHPEDYPDKPYVVSEYGDWEYYAQNAGLKQDHWGDLLPDERSSRQHLGAGEKRLLQQARNNQEAHNDNFTVPVFGDAYWVMFDYNRGYADDIETSGVMNIFRLPKYSYYFFKSQRNAGETVFGVENSPMVFIASYLEDPQAEEIRIFSNCEEVELFANGESMGMRQSDEDQFSGKLAHPPFTFSNSGHPIDHLLAIGKIDGEEVARHELRRPGNPVSILIEADLSGRSWESGCNDQVFIHARIVDENMQQVFDYDQEVEFYISGNAAIVGEDNPSAEAGIASILAVAGDQPGQITITARSGDLQSEAFIISTSLH